MNYISSSDKIALFGTSADPPTVGHQTILSWLACHYDLVVVWASDNPFKAHQTNLNHRSQMLELIIREIEPFKKNIILCQKISDRRTLHTVQKAKEIWGEVDFTLIIGADLVQQITTWYRVENLLKQVKILIVPRADYAIETADLAKLEALGGRYTIATLNSPKVSSSGYRVQGDTTVVTPAVENYIEHQQLYSNVVDKE